MNDYFLNMPNTAALSRQEAIQYAKQRYSPEELLAYAEDPNCCGIEYQGNYGKVMILEFSELGY